MLSEVAALNYSALHYGSRNLKFSNVVLVHKIIYFMSSRLVIGLAQKL